MDQSVVKSTGSSCRRPGSISQHTHGGSQLAVTPVPGKMMLFSFGLSVYLAQLMSMQAKCSYT